LKIFEGVSVYRANRPVDMHTIWKILTTGDIQDVNPGHLITSR